MKIRIIDANSMGVSLHRKDGDIVEVYWDEANAVYQDKRGYEYWIGWKDKYFEVLEEDSTEWSGEGLPPVGEKIMIRGTPSGSICEGVIDYIDKKHCVWHWFDEPSERTMYNRTFEMEFEPIKSEKDKEIDDLVEVIIGYYEYPKGAESYKKLAETLYDAKYKKTT